MINSTEKSAQLRFEPATPPPPKSPGTHHYTILAVNIGSKKSALLLVEFNVLENDNFQVSKFHSIVVYVSHIINVFVTGIILNIASPEHLMLFTCDISLRKLFELFSKEILVKNNYNVYTSTTSNIWYNLLLNKLDNDPRKRGKILLSHLCDFSYFVQRFSNCSRYIISVWRSLCRGQSW